jgi:uncharacterized protein (TIGR03437 family)
VIGYYETDFNAPSLGFYYHAGQSYLLSNLVVNPPAGLVLTGGTFFRGSNQILASGSLPGNSSANFLLTPASGGAATPSITSVVNGASFAPNISGGSWITILGGSLSATTRPWASSDFVGDNLPTNLNGVSVTVNGIAAYPAYISPTQINVLAPNDANPGKMMVQVTNSAGSSSAFPMLENAVAPGLFQINSTYAAARHADGTLVAPAGSIAGVTSSPATPGETIELFGTGFGPTSPVVPDGQMVGTAVPLADPATVTIGGAPAVVTYAGMISVGLIQLNVTIPMSAKAGNESIEAKVGDVTTPSGLFLNIGN